MVSTKLNFPTTTTKKSKILFGAIVEKNVLRKLLKNLCEKFIWFIRRTNNEFLVETPCKGVKERLLRWFDANGVIEFE